MARSTKFFCLSILFCLAFLTTIHAQVAPLKSLTAEQYVEQGGRQVREKKFDDAIESFKQALKLNPNLAIAHQRLGGVYINLGRSSEAVEFLKTAVQLDPENTAAHINLGIAYSNLRRGDEAVVELTIAKQLSPNDARVHLEMGNVLHNSAGRIEDALTAYVESRRLDAGNPVVHHNIGLMQMRLGKFSEALAPLEEALRIDPKYRNARYLLSDAYGNAGRYNDATDSWTKFLEIVPNGPEALTKRAWNYLYTGNHGREAAEDARTYLKVYGWNDSNSPYLAIIANLGYRQAGLTEEAQKVIAEAAQKISSDKFMYQIIRYLKEEISGEDLLKLAADNDKKTEARTYLGMDLLLKGKSDEARTHFAWVKEYGNRRFYEFPLAAEELKRLR